MEYPSREAMLAVWNEKTVSEIAQMFSVTPQQIYQYSRKFGLPPKRKVASHVRHGDPTPEEIKERAKAIRSKWSPEERQNRTVGHVKRSRWTPPVISVGEIEAPSFSRI